MRHVFLWAGIDYILYLSTRLSHKKRRRWSLDNQRQSIRAQPDVGSCSSSWRLRFRGSHHAPSVRSPSPRTPLPCFGFGFGFPCARAALAPCPALLPADSLIARQEEERDAAKGGLYGGRGGVHGLSEASQDVKLCGGWSPHKRFGVNTPRSALIQARGRRPVRPGGAAVRSERPPWASTASTAVVSTGPCNVASPATALPSNMAHAVPTSPCLCPMVCASCSH